MKIEMGESLFYSWLRHVKGCQLVQNNWKVSSKWTISHEEEIGRLMNEIDEYFEHAFGSSVFKNNASLNQLLRQGECDALGVCFGQTQKTYAIDVAFHGAGLNYGDRKTTVMKVIEKCVRTAFCLYGYMNVKDAEVIFASPKINPAEMKDLEPYIEYLNWFFEKNGFEFLFCLIANETFNQKVMQPILKVSDSISDSSELFLRSYQLSTMFSGQEKKSVTTAYSEQKKQTSIKSEHGNVRTPGKLDCYPELKVGQIAQRVLGPMLEAGKAGEFEVRRMQTAEYSKQMFDLQFPLLVKENSEFEHIRYYVKPITIRGERYRMCSQWFEVPANDDRSYLLSWIKRHSK